MGKVLGACHHTDPHESNPKRDHDLRVLLDDDRLPCEADDCAEEELVEADDRGSWSEDDARLA